jgi:cation transport regulator
MPYRLNRELPPVVRSHLPEHAQDIYREAYNQAYAAHAGDAERERRAHMIAWAAVSVVTKRPTRIGSRASRTSNGVRATTTS